MSLKNQAVIAAWSTKRRETEGYETKIYIIQSTIFFWGGGGGGGGGGYTID